MDSKRTYVYNVVLRENDVCPQGELLTDKELERIKIAHPRRDWPRTAKAKVYAESCYISFGVRFGLVKQYLKIRKNNMSSKRTYIATFWRSNPQLKNGGYFTTKEFQSISLQGATKQAERFAADNVYGGMAVKNVELKQENKLMNMQQE